MGKERRNPETGEENGKKKRTGREKGKKKKKRVAHRVKIPKARKALVQITSGGEVLLDSSAIDMY